MRFENSSGGVRVRLCEACSKRKSRKKNEGKWFWFWFSWPHNNSYSSLNWMFYSASSTAICPTSNRLCLFFLTSNLDWIHYPVYIACIWSHIAQNFIPPHHLYIFLTHLSYFQLSFVLLNLSYVIICVQSII